MKERGKEREEKWYSWLGHKNQKNSMRETSEPYINGKDVTII